ncbi:FMN-dependent NADH-azoreductase [Pseudoduganella flava]|uniref:FMN dependent NADH:quinone oxidoreductase n=1 Tax=Pseudoduganella flava TaxID=871742 RepID=A0A562Q4I9_9BURK|nr:FMN-dependent NADH-azoreductase [Pseudoduganella flava]QGZ41666.1 FMN-dependent NADH-azoreductase [Pseudoduganella flava]TWI51659.1 FMN-dependent NADH-azoreductase [Pseudoduganella flava]
MANVLYINSSVRSSGSLSRQLSAEFIGKWQANHPTDTIVERDLAANPVPHLTEEMLGAFFTAPDQRTAAQAQTVKLSDDLVDEVLAADVIVIGAPMYNFSVPSGLKAYIDHIARAGRTFKYTDKGPVGLIEGKKVYVFTASGGVYSEGPAAGYDFLATYLKAVLGFLGITDISFIRAEGVALGDAALAATLEKSRQSIDTLAGV